MKTKSDKVSYYRYRGLCKARSLFILCSAYLAALVIGIMLSIFLYRSNIVPDSVLLGKPICTFLMAAIIIFILLNLINFYAKTFNFRDLIIIMLLTFFINFNLWGNIPFNVVRSNSIMLLGYFYKSGDRPITTEEASAHIAHRYFVENDAIGRRIREQEKLGNLAKSGDGWVITAQGKSMANFLSRFSDLYGIENNNILKYYLE